MTNCLIRLLRAGFFDQVTPYLLEILCDDPDNSSFKDAVAIELSRSGLDWAQESIASARSESSCAPQIKQTQLSLTQEQKNTIAHYLESVEDWRPQKKQADILLELMRQ